jgi:N utilization substance protein B
MSTPRHRARETALQILYRYDSANEVPTGHALIEDLQKHFDHFQVPPQAREFAAELVSGTLSRRSELDELLEKYAHNWKVSRMSSIDRTLLRMAAHEMTHFQDIPHSVTIDEAIELGKQFGSAETSSFINGILDAIAQSLKNTQP